MTITSSRIYCIVLACFLCLVGLLVVALQQPRPSQPLSAGTTNPPENTWCVVTSRGETYYYPPFMGEKVRQSVNRLLQVHNHSIDLPYRKADTRIWFWFGSPKIPKATLFLRVTYNLDRSTVTVTTAEDSSSTYRLSPEESHAIRDLFEDVETDIVTPRENLHATNEEVRLAAIAALERNGPKALSVMSQLAELLHDENASIRIAAASALFRVVGSKPALQLLLDELTHGELKNRRLAADKLRWVARQLSAEDVVGIQKVLLDKDEKLRRTATQILGNMQKKARNAVPSLLRSLKDPEWGVRSSAALAIGSIGEASKPVVRALVQALSDPQHQVKQSAISALGRLGPAAAAALPALLASLRGSPSYKRRTAEAILKIDATNQEAAEVLRSHRVTVP